MLRRLHKSKLPQVSLVTGTYVLRRLPDMRKMSTFVRRLYTCVVKYDINAVKMCPLYLRAIWPAVRPQRDETTRRENIFLPGEL